MRILSWNINGIRTLPQYHPWNTLKTADAILDELKADIICLQEMKSTRQLLARTFAIPSTYDSFFSFPVNKGGYSGVAVYTSNTSARPIKAEEGLTGTVVPTGLKPPWNAYQERVSSEYPQANELNLFPDVENGTGTTPTNLDYLDTEGRTLTLDFGLFVLINTYSPNETSDARLPYKMNYHRLMQARVEHLSKVEGREVIVVGDLNVCREPKDHCDGHLESVKNKFWDHPARAWLKTWCAEGSMVDVVRMFWPDRKGMFTVWNQKISGRESNYGTRVDYILCTPGLLQWIKHGDIQPSIKGSDHCPIYIDLHDEIVVPVDGLTGESKTIKLVDVLGKEGTETPRLAAKYWEEYSGKQMLLSTFFGKGKKSDERISPTAPDAAIVAEDIDLDLDPPPSSSSFAHSPPSSLEESQLSVDPPKKRKISADDVPPSKSQPTKKGKPNTKAGQATLTTFFSQSSASKAQEKAEYDVDADHRLALELSASQETPVSNTISNSEARGKQANTTWSQLFAPLQPPRCTIHNEPAKELTVNKSGPNKGKNFFICSRPVGPGYDRGRSERLREEVDHQWKCNFFMWSSEVKRRNMQKGS